MRPWAAVHDQAQLPAERRLYMTATPRVWEAEDGRPRLVASMEDGSPVFGPVAYKLTLSEAIGRGIVAPYQVLCLDIRDPDLYAALSSEDTGSDAVRGARLAAVQTGLMQAAVKERFRRVLSFHSRVSEAEAMAAAVPVTARRLAEDDPDVYPPARQVWADWLYGEHAPGHRRQVLDEFSSDFLGGPAFENEDDGLNCGFFPQFVFWVKVSIPPNVMQCYSRMRGVRWSISCRWSGAPCDYIRGAGNSPR